MKDLIMFLRLYRESYKKVMAIPIPFRRYWEARRRRALNASAAALQAMMNDMH